MPTAPRCPVGMVTGQPGTCVGGGGGEEARGCQLRQEDLGRLSA